MFGAMLNYEQKGQTITLQYEKQIVRIQVLTNKVINVFVPYETNDHRSKAIEGEKELPTPFTLDKTEDCLVLSTDSVVCRIYHDFMIDTTGKAGCFVLTIAVKEKRGSSQKLLLSSSPDWKAMTLTTPAFRIIRYSA